MKYTTRRSSRPIIKLSSKNCHFCVTKTEPDYKEISSLTGYLTERGKIISRDRTGLCSKHQRYMTNAIKRARLIALLPFVVRA